MSRQLASDRVLRAFDIIATLFLLPAALLVGGVIAAIVALDSPGSVFYRSTRVGHGGKPFQMLKFRKMRNSAGGIALTSHRDERFTPIGHLLAITKLDELPQLWNVLRGEMRLVGPRPEVPEFVAHYPEAYEEILSVVPGMTGIAALELAAERHLFASEDDPVVFYTSQLMPAKLALDISYVRNRSLPGDVKILLWTLFLPLIRTRDQVKTRHRLALVTRAATVMGGALVLAVAFLSAGVAGT